MNLKTIVRALLERSGYHVISKRFFGISLVDDLQRLLESVSTPVVIDVGANCGQTLSWIKQEFHTARVWCYEPDPRAFAKLELLAKHYNNVTCANYALGKDAGLLPLFRNADSVTSSLLKSQVDHRRDLSNAYISSLRPKDAISVEVRRLGDEMSRLSLSRVDLLKTDCQGFDLQVLQGAEDQIASGQINLILAEVLFHPEYENQDYFHEMLPWLMKRGFALFGLYDVAHGPTGRILHGNALFKQLDLSERQNAKQ